MSKGKPKTALASLIDTLPVSELDTLSGSAGVIPVNKAVNNPNTSLFSNLAPPDDRIHKDSIVKIDPKKCRPWKFADRPEIEYGDISGLAESIKLHGQQEPVLARKIKAQGEIEYEIIFGNRRLQACAKINQSILAIIKDVDDKYAALYQKEENENREGLSDYAKAQSYKQLIDNNIFLNEKELSEFLAIPPQRLNDILSYTRIPLELANLVPNFHQISRKMATKLASLTKDPDNLKKLKKLAQKIGEKKLTSANLNDALKDKQIAKKEVVYSYDKNGKKIFSILSKNEGPKCVNISDDYSQNLDIDAFKLHIEKFFNNAKNR